MRNNYVFYHGQKNHFVLAYDLIKEVLARTHKKDHPSEFEYLRVPGSREFNQKLADLLRQGFETDNDPDIRNILLSVNFSLFGNSSYEFESSWAYFIKQHNMFPPAHFWDYIFYQLNLNPRYIHELLEIFKGLQTQEGNLLQIFLPKKKVDDYVYLSKAEGKTLAKGEQTDRFTRHYPLKNITVTDQEGKVHKLDPRTLDPLMYLGIYRQQPNAIDIDDMDRIQGRILLTNDFFVESQEQR